MLPFRELWDLRVSPCYFSVTHSWFCSSKFSVSSRTSFAPLSDTLGVFTFAVHPLSRFVLSLRSKKRERPSTPPERKKGEFVNIFRGGMAPPEKKKGIHCSVSDQSSVSVKTIGSQRRNVVVTGTKLPKGRTTVVREWGAGDGTLCEG